MHIVVPCNACGDSLELNKSNSFAEAPLELELNGWNKVSDDIWVCEYCLKDYVNSNSVTEVMPVKKIKCCGCREYIIINPKRSYAQNGFHVNDKAQLICEVCCGNSM